MRVWDIDPSRLCRQHLLGEHREIHAIWSILTNGKKGYSQHTETLRWVGRLRALYRRHEAVVREMRRRNYNHRTPLDARRARSGPEKQDRLVLSVRGQERRLREKECPCLLKRSAGAARRSA